MIFVGTATCERSPDPYQPPYYKQNTSERRETPKHYCSQEPRNTHVSPRNDPIVNGGGDNSNQSKQHKCSANYAQNSAGLFHGVYPTLFIFFCSPSDSAQAQPPKAGVACNYDVQVS